MEKGKANSQNLKREFIRLFEFVFIGVVGKIFRMLRYGCGYIYYRFFYFQPKLDVDFIKKKYLIIGGENLEEGTKAYREFFPDKVQAKIAEADLICEHIFDLLGSGAKRLSPKGKNYQPIDWHSDFKSGYVWNSKPFYRNICCGHIEGVDVKVPWELSRFQHLNILGQAYILTRDKKYAEQFVKQITDWIKNNPVGLGVNWRCTMDVAIRVANWLVAQEYFSEEGLIPDHFWHEFYTSIYEHGEFIMGHLEKHFGFTNNHYLSDLVGLFFIAIYCPFFKESKKWQEFVLRELTNEIESQVYPDGCSFEASTSYHRLALELFFYAELLGRRSGIEFPENYKKKVRKMFEFSLYCIKPNGMIPQIGDNDNGRFLIFCKRPTTEHKYLLSLATIYYKDSDYKISRFNFDEEAFWIFDESGKRSYDDLQFRDKPINSKAFPEAGWYIMRHNRDYCFVSCGPNGQNGRGGHAHNDKLSFELMLNGQDIIVDPGTYVYTPYPGWRNKFRSTAFHNTIQIDDIEQNDISKELFGIEQGIEYRMLCFEDKKDDILFEGKVEYSNYRVIHKRKFILNKPNRIFTVIDKLVSKDIHNFSINLCLGSGAADYDFQLQEGNFKKIQGFYSSEYGKKENIFFLKKITKGKSYFMNTLVIQRKQK